MTGDRAGGEPFDRRRSVSAAPTGASARTPREVGDAAVTGDPSTGVEGIVGRESTRHGGEVMTRDAVDDR
jgi:hypothetical protein